MASESTQAPVFLARLAPAALLGTRFQSVAGWGYDGLCPRSPTRVSTFYYGLINVTTAQQTRRVELLSRKYVKPYEKRPNVGLYEITKNIAPRQPLEAGCQTRCAGSHQPTRAFTSGKYPSNCMNGTKLSENRISGWRANRARFAEAA